MQNCYDYQFKNPREIINKYIKVGWAVKKNDGETWLDCASQMSSGPNFNDLPNVEVPKRTARKVTAFSWDLNVDSAADWGTYV